jgi:triosephosphate isomerase
MLHMTKVQSRPTMIGTNLKMNQTPDETAAFVRALAKALAHTADSDQDAQYFVIPPFTSLPAAVAANRSEAVPLWIGAQTMHWADEGAYTGEISARMLTSVGVDLVLLGHAERRGLFHETDAELSKKVPAAVKAGLRVLLAIGETADERAWGVGPETVSRQLKIALGSVDASSSSRISVAYEPVWSIGSGGTPAEPEDIRPIARGVREALTTCFGVASETIPVLYGGSVNPGNCVKFMALDEIDGLFVGRAARTVEGFAELVRAATR